MRLRRQITRMVVGLALVLGLAGCSSMDFLTQGAFKADGVPKDEYLVGGGMHIEYMAPADGRLYWVEETTGKILAMKSVKAEEKAEFGSDGMDPNMAKQKLGVDLKDAKFKLYFIPDR